MKTYTIYLSLLFKNKDLVFDEEFNTSFMYAFISEIPSKFDF